MLEAVGGESLSSGVRHRMKNPHPHVIHRSVARELTDLFRRNGYVRPSRERRLAGLGYGASSRGFEIRLTAASASELEHIRQLLRAAGFKPGAPFTKGNQLRQPIYGRETVHRFLEIVGESSEVT